jgi:predicted lipoprotein with Yx(FWY)xxD motif
MTRGSSMRFFARAAVVPLAALTLVGYGSVAGASTVPQKSKAARATVNVKKTNLGKVLVNSKGRTLYLFRADTGTTSNCSGECATDWPPLKASGTPTVGKGANASLVATSPRSDGTLQVTYNGHPLYTFEGDKKAGATNGQGLNAFGAVWYVVSPAGNEITRSPSSSGGSNSGGGGTPGY